mgnify:CR=1 FL=1
MENTQANLICPTDQKYVMFLPERYFKSTFFENIYKKLRKNLENLGIKLFCIDNFIKHYNSEKSHTLNVLFDDKNVPTANQLYIHMFGKLYYSDSVYNKKKIEKEREHLFLLAGKLGVNTIEYSTEISETSVTQANVSGDVNNVSCGISYTKSTEKKQGTRGEEHYENRGAAVYVNSKNKDEVDANIKESMDLKDSQIFSYEFYKQNPKLESFVYKRCNFKMSQVEYVIESEDIFDLSLAVKAYFVEYGLAVSFDKNIMYNEKIQYKLVFFSDSVLEEECAKRNYEYERGKSDPFYSIRKCYDKWDNENDKKSILYEIYDYVYKLCKQTYGRISDDKNNKKFYYFCLEDILRFIIKTQPDIKEEWVNFTHTSEIKDWIEEYLFDNLFYKIDILNSDSDDYEDVVITELKSLLPEINVKQVQSKLFWFNINWEETEENIKLNIKNELNNDCEIIQMSINSMDFTILLGDKQMHKNKKIDNGHIRTKRTFNPVSRIAKVNQESCERYLQLKIEELESDKLYMEKEYEDLKLKLNENTEVESKYRELQSSYDELSTINNILSYKYSQIKTNSDLEIMRLNARNLELENTISAYENDVKELNNRIIEIDKQKDDLATEKYKMDMKLSELNIQLGDEKEKNTKLIELIKKLELNIDKKQELVQNTFEPFYDQSEDTIPKDKLNEQIDKIEEVDDENLIDIKKIEEPVKEHHKKHISGGKKNKKAKSGKDTDE